MIIVINLLRNIFIIMFFILMILEIIVLLALVLLYNIPLQNHLKTAFETSSLNFGEISYIFNSIYVKKFENLATDLLLIAKHNYPMYLTLYNQNNTSGYPNYNKKSVFVQGYNNTSCLSTSDYDFLTSNISDKMSENDIINQTFNDSNINKISIWKNNLNTTQITYFCYSVSMLKTIFTRNRIIHKKNPFVDRFVFFFNESNNMLQYPVNKTINLTNSIYPYQFPNCSNVSCLSPYQKIKNRKNYDFNSQIFFDNPIFYNNYYYSRGCIKIPFEGSMDMACIDVNLNNLLKENNLLHNTDNVKLFLVYPENNDLIMFYTNQITDYSQFNYSAFNNSAFKQYNLSNKNTILTLYHGIYNSLFSNYSQISIIDDTLKEYDSIIKNFNDYIEKKFFPNNSACNLNDALETEEIPYLFNQPLTFLDDQVTLSSYQKLFQPKIDTFQISIHPVYLNYSSYNNSMYIFNNNCSPYILFYSVVVSQNGNDTLYYRIYLILILKCVRSCFFFISLLVFAIIFYFILCEIYVKFLIIPIKYTKENLEILIKERNNPECFEDEKPIETRPNNSKENEINNVENSEEKIKYKFTDVFTNIETKKLEDMIENLKKIILMKNTQGKFDFKEKSKIYKKFLKDSIKSDKEHYRQCLLIIAYSKYKNSEYEKAYKNLERLFRDTEAEEEMILGKNDSFDQKLINLPAIIPNAIQYLNDFTENDIPGEEDLKKFAGLRILNQKIYYFYGFLKFSDYKKKRIKIKTELMANPELINNKEKLKDEVKNKMKIYSKLLVDASKFLNKSKKINNSMHFNKIKSIFILILLSNCAYLSEEYPEASNHLREALLAFSDLNKLFFEKKLDDQVDPRIMFIINGVIMEQILYHIGKICNRVQKKKLAALVFNKLLEITYFRSENIHRKACNKLYDILFLTKFTQQKNQEAIYYLSECLLKKNKNRFNNENKSLLIMVSENLLKNFCSHYELREVLLKCIDKHLNKSDMLNYIQFDNDIKNIVNFDTVENNLKRLQNDNDFCKYSENLMDFMKIDFAKIVKKSIDLFKKENNNNIIDETSSKDRYIFLFIFSNDFRFQSTEESHEIIQLLIVNKISLYLFILDDITEKKIAKIKQYLNFLVEGYLILVKNFQIIEGSFNNITPVSTRKKQNGEPESSENCFSHNILESKFENHKFIL